MLALTILHSGGSAAALPSAMWVLSPAGCWPAVALCTSPSRGVRDPAGSAPLSLQTSPSVQIPALPLHMPVPAPLSLDTGVWCGPGALHSGPGRWLLASACPPVGDAVLSARGSRRCRSISEGAVPRPPVFARPQCLSFHCPVPGHGSDSQGSHSHRRLESPPGLLLQRVRQESGGRSPAGGPWPSAVRLGVGAERRSGCCSGSMPAPK